VRLTAIVVGVTVPAGEGAGRVDQDQPSPRGRPSSQDTGTADGQDELAVQFSRLARTLQQPDDPERTLEGIVQAAVQLIPGVDEASVSAVQGRRRVVSQAPTGELARDVDALQDELGQGPCLDAAYEHQTVRVADMATETRWPRFTERALQAGAAGMLSFQLYVEGDDLGALNLYSRRTGAFDDESEHVGLLFASHAAIAFDAARQQTGLARSVATRQLIGQAQGILMERHKITADRAFALLVQASQHRNHKLRDVADALVRSGQLPDGQ
jgi:ANTAR domain/GAF domain